MNDQYSLLAFTMPLKCAFKRSSPPQTLHELYYIYDTTKVSKNNNYSYSDYMILILMLTYSITRVSLYWSDRNICKSIGYGWERSLVSYNLSDSRVVICSRKNGFKTCSATTLHPSRLEWRPSWLYGHKLFSGCVKKKRTQDGYNTSDWLNTGMP